MLVIAMSTLIAQDIAGNYRVSALDVQYYDIARQDVDVNVTDVYGAGVVLTLQKIMAGDLFYGTHSGPYNQNLLNTIGVNLNVNFYEDGSCTLAEGSYYPDVNEEACVSSVQVLPITDDMVYSSDLTALSPLPSTNLIGLPSISARAYAQGGGNYAGGLSLDQALIFDYFPQGGTGYVYQYGTDFIPDFCVDQGAGLPDGCPAANQSNGLAPVSIPLAIRPTASGYPGWPANFPLPGVHGGWVQVANLPADLGASQVPLYLNDDDEAFYGVDHDDNPDTPDYQVPVGGASPNPNLFAEWHAIDGAASESGFGDFIGQDEDGFDGDFDRTFGLPVLPSATYFTGSAGCEVVGAWATDLGSTPVAGDASGSLTDGVTAGCYASVTAGVEAGCYDAVIAGIAGQCEAVGGVANTVYGGCVEQATGDDFAAACGLYGVTASVTQACLDAGGPAEAAGGLPSCSDLAVAYDAACLGDCDCAIGYATSTDENSLCMLAGQIGAAASGDDCTAFASSFTEETLNGYAITFNGATCPDIADSYSLETLDGIAASMTGATCPQTGAGWAALCIAGVDVANDVWVMNPDPAYAPWSQFVTGNAVAFGGMVLACVEADAAGIGACMQGGGTYDDCVTASTGACGGAIATDGATGTYLVSTNDSGYAADPSNMAAGGRWLFNFAPTCIPEIEVRQVVIEAVELGGQCLANGDANEDGDVNVLDVVGMVQSILGNGLLTDGGTCNADINADGTINVLDVVSVVQTILGNRATSASAVEIIKSSEGVSFVADGYVGGIQMTINHGDDFSIEMTDKAMVADYRTEGNSTTLMVVDPGSGDCGDLFVAEGNFTIVTVVAAANGEYIDISVPTAFSVSNAYPNPFNPTTSLNINLDAASHVSVKVFNVMGQLVDVVTEGQMTEGPHAISWDASTVASGVYFINTEVGSSLSSQKVMLLK